MGFTRFYLREVPDGLPHRTVPRPRMCFSRLRERHRSIQHGQKNVPSTVLRNAEVAGVEHPLIGFVPAVMKSLEETPK